MINKQKIINLFDEYWTDIPNSDAQYIIKENGGISAFECILMYLYILKTKPKNIIEFSPNHGYSTIPLAMAQRVLDNKNAFATFEILKHLCDFTKERLDGVGLANYCNVIKGDAIANIPDWIKNNNPVEFCFIDSNHTNKFAIQYIKNIFPLLSNCIIGIHDICSDQKTEDGKTSFRTSLQSGTHSGGEENPVREYIFKNTLDYCVLHSITGGSHEGARLPNNVEFYDEVKKITNINFSSISHPCPKTLFLKVK